ncbi:glutamate receptor-like [Penaeus japonicus]|uniref:glutamate receptor-like n=1 Tax=Penaeus japonicus TaxID=27405 RepID=UPI001C713274|nr:glutamate receptor-like [Penaeus japonicus]
MWRCLLEPVCFLGVLVLIPSAVRSQTTSADQNRNTDLQDVDVLVTQIVEEHLAGCYLVFVTADDDHPVFNSVFRSLLNNYEAGVVLDLRTAKVGKDSDLLNELKAGDDKFACRVFIVVLGYASDVSLPLTFLEDVNLFLWPYTRVLFIGADRHVQNTLKDDSLRNTVHALYLALGEGAMTHEGGGARREVEEKVKKVVAGDGGEGEEGRVEGGGEGERSIGRISVKSRLVKCYLRCLFCNAGEVGVTLLDEWSADGGFLKHEELFPDQFRDMMGHQFKIVSLDWFPIMDFSRDSDESKSTVTLRDSVDVRMLKAFASTLNFTYEMRVPWDNQWGTSTPTGNWTGVVGTLQHHKADFSMVLSWMWGRRQVVDYTRIYLSEPIVMIMSKPRPLPQYLALVRPMSGEIWAAIFVSSLSAGVILWMLQRSWGSFSGNPGLSLSTSILYTWSILFEEPPPHIPTNISGEMFIGWWWLYCTLITVVYRGSLIAHLSVPSASPAIDSFSQLVDEPGWTWGYEPSYGAGWEWFKLNENPTISKIFQGIEIMEFDEQMERVLKGRHALITWKYKIRSLIDSLFTDDFGYTPIYTAREEYFNYGGYGWAFRKGAPFRRAIDMEKQRLIESGLVVHWMNELIADAARKARKENREGGRQQDASDRQDLKVETGKVVLSLHHLQGVFYLLALGFSVRSVNENGIS